MSKVIIRKDVENDLKFHIYSILDDFGLDFKNKNVLIKPNLFKDTTSETGGITDPRVVEVIIKYIFENGGYPFVAEGASAWITDIQKVLDVTGYQKIIDTFGIKFIDLNKDEAIEVNIPNGLTRNTVKVAKTYLDADLRINVPVMKTHVATIVTLSLKNLKGVIVAKEKYDIHKRGLNLGIVDYNKVLPCEISIIDGIYCMEGNGPDNGYPKKMDMILASDDRVALDDVAARIMGFNPDEIPSIVYSEKEGIGSRQNIEIDTNVKFEDIVSPFKKPNSSIQEGLFYTVASSKFGFFILHRLNLYKLLMKTLVFFKIRDFLVIEKDRCINCKLCEKNCPHGVINLNELDIDKYKCTRCLLCIEICPKDAIHFSKQDEHKINCLQSKHS